MTYSFCKVKIWLGRYVVHNCKQLWWSTNVLCCVKQWKCWYSHLQCSLYVVKQDLFTIMIQGPSRTPYEDGLFFFDVQLPSDYPNSPPVFFYISYCSDRLNPNLYEDGKVCVSLLGTWTGKVWMWTFLFFPLSVFFFHTEYSFHNNLEV